jgi:hypothetical protein
MEAVLGTSALVASAVVLAATGTLGVFVVAAVTLPLLDKHPVGFLFHYLVFFLIE